jgi:hypothetical protein
LLDVEVRIRAMPNFLRSECDRDTLPWWTQEWLTLLASEGGCLAVRRMVRIDVMEDADEGAMDAVIKAVGRVSIDGATHDCRRS